MSLTLSSNRVNKPNTQAYLLVSYAQKDGAIAAINNFFSQRNLQTLSIDQHFVEEEQRMFVRLALDFSQFELHFNELKIEFEQLVASLFNMHWQLHFDQQPLKVAIFVSKHDHVLLDLLIRFHNQEFAAHISMVISNHNELRAQVETYGLPFHYIDAKDKSSAEARMYQYLEGQADLIVLARYMQILSDDFITRFANRILNIHHSFLPAFIGADPYRQAYQRGVKLIGATAHYVTCELDEGPIIEQDAVRVSHRYSINDLKTLGKDLERNVLQRALKWHLQHRIICYEDKTYVFYK